MEKETIGNILTFLKEKEGKEIPQNWNLIERLETHPDDIQYIHKGSLTLKNSDIKKLPNKLYVGGSLFIMGCEQLSEFPNNLYVDGDFMMLSGEKTTELPDRLFVMGFLQLAIDHKILKYPKALFVKDTLFLTYTNIAELPNQIFVGEDLLIQGTPLADKYTDEELYEMAKSLEGGQIRGKIIR